MKTVLANGCFDPLHPGHIAHLQEAATFGDVLIVALTLDAFVQKGPHRPYLSWEERRLMLSAMRCVSAVVPSRNAWEAIEHVRPQVFVKGGDWRVKLPKQTVAACRMVGAEIKFTESLRFGVDELVRRMRA